MRIADQRDMTILALLVVFLLWKVQGGLALACAMWVLTFLHMRHLPPRLKDLPVAWLAVLFGLLCNALVTVANGGFMPVSEPPVRFKPLFPTWIAARPSNHLLLLADHRWLYYFSVGDVFIISGALLWCIGPWILRNTRQWQRVPQDNGPTLDS